MSTTDLASAITVACPQFVNADAIQITCLSRTPASGSYRVRLSSGQSVIAKLYVGTAKWKAAQERHIIESLTDGSVVRTAKVLGHGQLDDHDASVLITSDLGEYTLWRAIEDGTYSFPNGLGLIGHLLANFHDVNLAKGEHPHPWPDAVLARRIERQLSILDGDPASRFTPLVVPALETVVRLCQRLRTQVECHGDLHPANVILYQEKNGTIAAHLIDFESAVRCLPEYDLAKSIVTSSALADDERTALLAGYDDRCRVSDELLYAFIVFHVVDGWVHAALLEGRDRLLWRARIETALMRYAPLF